MNFQQLSDREIDILRLVAQAKSNKEIAAELFISVNTVKVHLANIFQKIKVSSRMEASLYALETGIIKSPVPETKPQNPTVVEPNVPKPDDAVGTREIILKPPIWLFIIIVMLSVALILFVTRYFRASPILPRPQDEITFDQRWQELGPMPIGRSRFASVLFGNEFYVIGGQTNSDVTGRVDVYDPKSYLWRTVADKLTPVKDVTAVVIGGKIFVPGGETLTGALTDKVEVYDPRRNVWEEKNRLPFPVSSYAMASFEGNLYLFGGRTPKGISDINLIYDPDEDSWEQIPKLVEPIEKATAVVFQSKIYLIGGADSNGFNRTVQSFSPARFIDGELSWEKGPNLPSSYQWTTSQTIGELIFVVALDNNNRAVLLQYSGGETQWASSIQASTRKIGVNAGSFVSEGYVYLLGGEEEGFQMDKVFRYQAIFLLSIPIINK